MVVGSLLFDFSLPHRPAAWVTFAVSAGLAFVVVFAWKFLVSLSSFWLLRPAGVVQLAGGLYTFGSGSLLPLAFMPDALEGGLRSLPFAAMLQLPIEVLLDGGVVAPLLLQLAWALTLLASGRAVLHRAQRRLVVQGG